MYVQWNIIFIDKGMKQMNRVQWFSTRLLQYSLAKQFQVQIIYWKLLYFDSKLTEIFC